MPKVLFRLLIALCIFFAATIQNAYSAKLDSVKIQLKWKHQFQFAGFYAALEQGFYSNAGLDVTLIEGDNHTNTIEEVISGRANYGLDSPKLLIARTHGVPVVAMAAIFQHSPEVLISTKDKEITSINQLKGKKLILSEYGIASTQAMFRKHNITVDSMQVLSGGNYRDSLLLGTVDAIDDYIIDAPYLIQKAGKETVIFKPIDYGIDFYGDIFFTSEKELKNNRQRSRLIHEATIQGWIYAMNNKEEIINLILEKYDPSLSREMLVYEAQQMEDLLMPKLVRPGHMNIERWHHIAETYQLLGLIGDDYSLDGFLLSHYISESDKTLRKWIRIILAILGITLAILTLLISFNRRLKKAVEYRTKELSLFNQNLQSKIEERNLLMQSLETSEERFKRLFEDAPISLWEEDFSELKKTIDKLRLKGVSNFREYLNDNPEELVNLVRKIRFINLNKTTLKYFKANTKEELLNNIQKTFFPGSLNSLKEGIVAFSEGKYFYSSRDKQSTLKGESLHVSVNAKIMAGHEHTWEKVLVSLLDITELVRLTKDLENTNVELGTAKQKAEESDRLKTAFLSNMSHEVRTPMMGILGFIDLLKTGDASREEAIHFLQLIEENAIQLLNIITNIVEISKMEAGQINVEYKPIDLKDFISHIKDVFTLKLKEHNKSKLQLVYHIDEGIPEKMTIKSDETRLRQIISNLIENAIKFTSEGSITLGVKKSDTAEQLLLFYVADTGRGINDEQKEKIFNRFYKENSPNGTGLGLSIAQSLVNLLGGSIEVESSIGKGSTFKFTHPINN
ncbi:ABC transporter substrate-binding protein [Carboxylicivirga sp. N1Y90]|uniref:ABC transporter substrate-binding protein n=1 Tax=Carboxylicivirga fragile TaxID=3417571 RepID=UPI003D328E4E|nr:ABC transporter substrate-binding protein [Marinilabiliaceae bacterium N1Y90]